MAVQQVHIKAFLRHKYRKELVVFAVNAAQLASAPAGSLCLVLEQTIDGAQPQTGKDVDQIVSPQPRKDLKPASSRDYRRLAGNWPNPKQIQWDIFW